MICLVCGMEIEPNEYHPYAFCVLVEAGLNPLTVVLEAAKELAGAAPMSHKIYLQVKDEDGEIPDEVTWCIDRIHDTDIEYVRAWWEETQ